MEKDIAKRFFKSGMKCVADWINGKNNDDWEKTFEALYHDIFFDKCRICSKEFKIEKILQNICNECAEKQLK